MEEIVSGSKKTGEEGGKRKSQRLTSVLYSKKVELMQAPFQGLTWGFSFFFLFLFSRPSYHSCSISFLPIFVSITLGFGHPTGLNLALGFFFFESLNLIRPFVFHEISGSVYPEQFSYTPHPEGEKVPISES